jgi:hypothetical protein
MFFREIIVVYCENNIIVNRCRVSSFYSRAYNNYDWALKV